MARGDYAFASQLGYWKPLQDSEIGQPVSDYVAVARRRVKVEASVINCSEKERQ